MNYKIALGIIGAAIVIGGVVYFVNKATNNNQDKSESNETTSSDSKKNGLVQPPIVSESAPDLGDVKFEAAEKISERHEEAKKVMSEAVNDIFDDTLPETTKNEEAKKKISEDLDNL